MKFLMEGTFTPAYIVNYSGANPTINYRISSCSKKMGLSGFRNGIYTDRESRVSH